MTPIETIALHYQVIIQKDIEAIQAKYLDSPETYVVLEGPRLTTRGYKFIAKGWNDFCNSPLELSAIEWVEGPFCKEKGEMAWVAGVIQLNIVHNENKFQNLFRASFILEKVINNWKISHEHVSIAHPDPYGIGDWLKK